MPVEEFAHGDEASVGVGASAAALQVSMEHTDELVPSEYSGAGDVISRLEVLAALVGGIRLLNAPTRTRIVGRKRRKPDVRRRAAR